MKILKISVKVLSAIIAAALLCCLVLKVGMRYHIEFAGELGLSPKETAAMLKNYSRKNEAIYGMICETARENWDKVLKISSRKDYKDFIGTYCRNLACAMKGHLGDSLMTYYQPFTFGLFLPLESSSSRLSIICSDEVWYQIGELTMAEHSAMLGLVFSPSQGGPRFYRRLAQINLAAGDTAAAEKYLNLLESSSGGRAVSDKRKMESSWKEKALLAPKKDMIHGQSSVRAVLSLLVESNPENIPAYEYLLCYDLMCKDVEAFAEDWIPGRKASRLYQEASLIYMASHGMMDPETASLFGISDEVFEQFSDYTEIYGQDGGSGRRLSGKYRHTYWYFYHFAKVNENCK